nr:hypothetical protein [Lachnospiraceae bacterium]
FRLQASGSRQISNNTTVKIPAQVVLSEEEINSFSLDYKSSSSFSIKAGKASSTNIYEYCIINTNDIEAGIGLDKPEELTWKDITSSDAVNISNTKNSCDDGSLIYIRRKAVKSLGDDDYKLASNTYLLETIKYPGNVAMDENCQLDSIAGVCRSDNSEGYLSFSFFSPGSGAVTRLKFGTGENDMKEIGTSDFKSVVTANEGANKEEYGYIIKTTIYSTSALEKYLAADAESVTLKGIYCIGDGTEFCTLEESLVSLTLHRASKVIVPGEVLKAQIKTSLPGLTDIDRIGYTKSIERVYLSNRTAANGFTEDADQNVFRTVIKLGDSSSINNNQDSVISGIKYAGIDLTEEHYKVYEMADDTSAHNDKYLIVEFYADLIEQDPNITIRDESAAIVILLKNGERLSDVTMKLVSSARLSAGCTGASINPELIEETQNVTTTVNQVPTSVSQPNRDYYLEYELNIPGYTGLIVTNAIFMNTSVLLDTDSANGRVYLSVAKLKEIMQNKTETQSGNVILIFNNGFKITKGYSLTLIK